MAQGRIFSGGEILLLSRARGINNVADPFRVSADPTTGETELLLATNVDIDETGAISRRPGYEQLFADANCHSPFASIAAGGILYISNSALMFFNGTTRTSLGAITGESARMYYIDILSRCYFSNGIMNGYVEDGQIYSWDYLEPTRPDMTNQLSAVPPGTHLSLFSSRLYFAIDNLLCFTEPLAYHAFSKSRGYFMFPAPINAILPTDDGLFVSTTQAVYFLHGLSINDFRLSQVAAFPLIKDSAVLLEAGSLGEASRLFGTAWIAATSKGLFVLGRSGLIENITYGRYTVPGQAGSACIVNNRYILTVTD